MIPMTHIYYWQNNAVRKALFGRKCRIVNSGKMCTVLIEFEDGERITTSRRALRRIDKMIEYQPRNVEP